MKPNVLLAGGSGYIGKNISSAIENDANLFALSKYPNTKKEFNHNIKSVSYTHLTLPTKA